MANDLRAFEDKAYAAGCRRVAGVDEAGRGPLAGPVVAAAVILPRGFAHPGIDDSKRLSPARREALYGRIYEAAEAIGIGIVDAREIDRVNILRAAPGAMAMAVENLFPPPDRLLVDGPFPLPLPIPQEPIPGGDGRSLSIAAASIIAKVTRDRLMALCDTHFPGWDFARHKGYPTAEHRAAIRLPGCPPIHRRSFRGVREALDRVEEAVHGGPPPGAC